MFEFLEQSKIKTLLNKLLIYAVIAYAFIILGRAIWTNFQLKRQIDGMKQEIASLQEQNQNLNNLILYYQTDSFKEVEARAKLGLKKPGETVVSVPTKKFENYQAEAAADQANASSSKDSQTANWESWWKYIFR